MLVRLQLNLLPAQVPAMDIGAAALVLNLENGGTQCLPAVVAGSNNQRPKTLNSMCQSIYPTAPCVLPILGIKVAGQDCASTMGEGELCLL